MNDDLDHKLSKLRGRVQTHWSETRVERVLTALERSRERRQRLRRGAARVGIVCGLLLLAPLLFLRLSRERTPEVAVALRLPDGSVATALSPDTDLKEAAPQPGRTVLRLLRGSARFAVQRNPSRVFRVEAGRTAVEVLGTQFTMTRRAELTQVAVIQGRVRVLWDSHYTELGAGEQGTFPPPEPAALLPETVAPEPTYFSETDKGSKTGGDSATSPAVTTDARAGDPAPGYRPRTSSSSSGSRAETERPRKAAALARWRLLAQDGQFDQAYQELEAKDLAAASDEAGDLLLLADIARLSHHPAEAVAPLGKLLQKHRSDPRAALCAFTLGRILMEDLGKPQEAAAAFREAQSLDPGFAMIEDALAREVQALWRAGDSTAAHERALEYLRRFPDGSGARSVRRFGAID